jgi:hypothetical protein
MEDVLSVYTRAYDPRFPVLCLDETSKQLLADARPAEPVRPGQPARIDYEYRRLGTANVFLACEPLRGWRETWVTDRRTRQDWAQVIQELLEVHYPSAERLVLVLDNLNTHTPGSLYETFPPEKAERLAERLELHYTPKHGSWLNIAEIELSVLARQCTNCRVASLTDLAAAVAAWTRDRNASQKEVDWRFTTADARIKLNCLYPSVYV